VVTGAAVAVAAVAAEGRLGARDPRATDPTSWWGILPPVPPTGITRGALAGVSALAIVALSVCWLVLVRLALTDRLRPRVALAAVLAWSAPFALGPPLFSRDAYAYAAQGELARRGLDPATHGVAALAGDPTGAAFMTAVDPRWRDTHTPYDLLGAGPTVTLVTLRIIALGAVALLVTCTVRLSAGVAGRAPGAPTGGDNAATGRAAAIVIAIVGANPVTVIHLVGGLHLDALVAAALAGALLLERRRSASRRPATGRGAGAAGTRSGAWWGTISFAGAGATALACFAGTVKVTAFLGLLWLLVAHARAAKAAAGRVAITAAVAVDLAVTAAVLALSMLGSGFGPTWLRALSTSGALTTGVAPASMLANLIAALARLGGAHLSTGIGSALLGGSRSAVLAVAALICAWLLWLAWQRPARAWQADLADDARGPAGDGWYDGLPVLGIGGLAVALGSPVLYPWYLAPALPMLGVLVAGWHLGHRAPGPSAVSAGRRCRVAVGVVCAGSIWLCAATLSPLAQTWRLLAPAGPAGALPLVVTATAATALLISAGTAAARAISAAGRSGPPREPDQEEPERRAATR
jgi:hypothetical protein